MTSLSQFWNTLDSNYGRDEVLRQWELMLGEAFVPLRKYMHPINEKARKYPNPKKKNGRRIWSLSITTGRLKRYPTMRTVCFMACRLS
jgi:hypothetical protein